MVGMPGGALEGVLGHERMCLQGFNQLFERAS